MVVDLDCKLEKSETGRGKGVFDSLLSSFNKFIDEFFKNAPYDSNLFGSYLENYLCYLHLLFFEDEISDWFIIWEFNKKRLDKRKYLIDHFFLSEVDISFYDGFCDVLCNFSFSLEF